MRKVFIADAHLKLPDDENFSKLLRFLDELRGTTETLFILGDLFEFWIGYPAGAFPHYAPVLEKLLLLHESGTDIVYFEGNHDFHMGEFFEETLQARVYAGPALLELDGKRVYLCHGDQINSKDYGYRLLRRIFHSAITRGLARIVPATITSTIARYLGKKSKANHGTRRSRWDYPAIMREFAAARFSEGCDMVITGHFHLPLLEHSGMHGEHFLLSLGDWISHYTYGEMVGGTLTLKSYP